MIHATSQLASIWYICILPDLLSISFSLFNLIHSLETTDTVNSLHNLGWSLNCGSRKSMQYSQRLAGINGHSTVWNWWKSWEKTYSRHRTHTFSFHPSDGRREKEKKNSLPYVWIVYCVQIIIGSKYLL